MKNILSKIAGFSKPKKSKVKEILVVSGLPRSGTSMMMKMIEAGGVPVMIDNIRVADTDNPKGYYELERIKQMDKGDKEFIADAQGKVVKVISALLAHLSPNYQYRVVFMNRRIEEVVKSQGRMLVNRGEDTDKLDDETLKGLLQKHASDVKKWIGDQPNYEMLEIDYNDMVKAPLDFIPSINIFLGGKLDEQAMAAIVDPALYRNR